MKSLLSSGAPIWRRLETAALTAGSEVYCCCNWVSASNCLWGSHSGNYVTPFSLVDIYQHFGGGSTPCLCFLLLTRLGHDCNTFSFTGLHGVTSQKTVLCTSRCIVNSNYSRSSRHLAGKCRRSRSWRWLFMWCVLKASFTWRNRF
jgi:hypothetical protein